MENIFNIIHFRRLLFVFVRWRRQNMPVFKANSIRGHRWRNLKFTRTIEMRYYEIFIKSCHTNYCSSRWGITKYKFLFVPTGIWTVFAGTFGSAHRSRWRQWYVSNYNNDWFVCSTQAIELCIKLFFLSDESIFDLDLSHALLIAHSAVDPSSLIPVPATPVTNVTSVSGVRCSSSLSSSTNVIYPIPSTITPPRESESAYLLLDVRTEEEYTAAHIKTGIHGGYSNIIKTSPGSVCPSVRHRSVMQCPPLPTM